MAEVDAMLIEKGAAVAREGFNERERLIQRLADAANSGMWLCRVGCVLCVFALVLQLVSLVSSFPADWREVFTWESVGYGYTDGLGMSHIQGYLVEEPDETRDPARSYLMFEADGSVPLAKTYAACASLAFGLGVLAAGERFFRRISISGRPFESPRVRELKVIGVLVVLAAIVPNIVGLAISTWTYNVYLTQGQFTWGVWEPGVVNGWLIVLGAFVLMMARVFRYGCKLQDQDDRLL